MTPKPGKLTGLHFIRFSHPPFLSNLQSRSPCPWQHIPCISAPNRLLLGLESRFFRVRRAQFPPSETHIFLPATPPHPPWPTSVFRASAPHWPGPTIFQYMLCENSESACYGHTSWAHFLTSWPHLGPILERLGHLLESILESIFATRTFLDPYNGHIWALFPVGRFDL